MAYVNDWDSVFFTMFHHWNNRVIRYVCLLNLLHGRGKQCENIAKSLIHKLLNLSPMKGYSRREGCGMMPVYQKDRCVSKILQEIHHDRYNCTRAKCYDYMRERDAIHQATCTNNDWEIPMTKNLIHSIRDIMLNRGWRVKIFEHPMLLWTCRDLWDPSIIKGKNNKYGILTSHLKSL